MANTKFEVGDFVYLVASAKRGFLEIYQVCGIKTIGSDFIYVIDINPMPQRSISSGNYVSDNSKYGIEFAGDQLTNDKSEAILLAIQYHESQVEYLSSLLG